MFVISFPIIIFNKKNMEMYAVLDSRTFTLSQAANNPNLNDLDDNWARMIMSMGSGRDCCEEANSGMFGDMCVVCTEDGIIKWDWFVNDQWEVRKQKTFGRYDI